MSEYLKAIIFGIVEGITEWLPVSSTGHMILLDEFIKLNVSENFREVFLVLIQLGAILAVIIMFWKKIFPFQFNMGKENIIRKDIFSMWFKVIAAVIPSAIIGVLFDEFFEEKFYNYQTVSIALIVFGVFFIVIENWNKKKLSVVNSIGELSYKTAVIIGLFQVIAAVFPGVSRSGATIVGALLIGVSRTVAAEFTFFLAIPTMFGASLLKLVKLGFGFTTQEYAILFFGLLSAFLVSLLSIQFLMNYVKKHDFKVFGWYRIVLGTIVMAYFIC
ncbi:MAG: undecaprenyl-diphosphate phosphatase [Lachnospiraceae bacterium]|nr:undecaprenyl-diphosphate phosphatase [Lachnospiraceae bacterium]